MTAKRQKRLLDDEGRPETGTERTCVVTRRATSPDRLIRFALSPDGGIVPDVECRLPGRGVWVSGDRDAIAKAVASRAFARSLRRQVVVDPGLADIVDRLLLRRTLDALSLANKAGAVIAGFQQVDAALEKSAVAALVHGADAAADGRGKLDRKFRAIQRERGSPAPVVDFLASSEISLAMGRVSVVHAALTPGGLTERFLRAAERVARYRSVSALPVTSIQDH